MLQILPVNEANVFAVKASGKLTDADYQQLLPVLEKQIKRYGELSLLLELENFSGWDNKALWDDLKLGIKHDHDFKRIAIVGEKSWQHWMSWLANLTTASEVQYFKRDELFEAWDWLREEQLALATKAKALAEMELSDYKHILIPVDFSIHSDYAIKRGLEFAKQNNADVTLLHVHDYTPPMVEYAPILPSGDGLFDDNELFKAAQQKLSNLATATHYPELKHETIWGLPKSGIISFAEAQQVDLIVMGSHGRSGFARLLGSTAAGVMNNSRCDVMVVKTGSER